LFSRTIVKPTTQENRSCPLTLQARLSAFFCLAPPPTFVGQNAQNIRRKYMQFVLIHDFYREMLQNKCGSFVKKYD